jgi:oligosaccharide repeat unit polymerase
MNTAILINLIAIFTLISYLIVNDFWHPSTFAGILWIFILLIGQAAGFKDLSLIGAIYIFLFINVFIIFSVFGTYLCKSYPIPNNSISNHRFKLFFFGTLIVTLWTLYFYIIQAAQYPSIGSYLFTVRNLSIDGESILQEANFLQRKAPILIYAAVLFYALILAKQNKSKIWEKLIFFFTLMLGAVVLMAEGARASFFILSGAIFIIYQSHGKLTLFGAVLSITLLVLFFSTITLFRVFGNDLSVSYLDVLKETGSDLAFYCCSGPVAFDYVANNLSEFQTNFFLTLNSVQHLLHNIGLLQVYQPSLTLGADQSLYVNVMSDGYRAGNVYTFIYPLVHDFGFLGGLVITSLIGISIGYLYNLKKNNWFPCIMYAIFMSSLIFSTFNEYWVSIVLSPGFIYQILIGVLIFSNFKMIIFKQ